MTVHLGTCSSWFHQFFQAAIGVAEFHIDGLVILYLLCSIGRIWDVVLGGGIRVLRTTIVRGNRPRNISAAYSRIAVLVLCMQYMPGNSGRCFH